MGGSSNTSSSVKVPEYLSAAAKEMLKQSQANARIGYTPYYGPDVAAMTPAQIAAMQGTNSAASAFGLQTVDPMAGMPAATDYNGMSAYSSGAGYDAALAELKARFPGQFAAIMAQFVDPVTGMMAGATSGQTSSGMNNQSRTPERAANQDFWDRINSGSGGPGNDGPAEPVGGPGSSGNWGSIGSTVGSYLPGGVNSTGLLSSLAGTVRNAISPQGAPTAANRPPTRPQGLGR